MSTHSDKSWIIGRVTMSADMPRQQTCQTSRQVLDNWTCNNVPRLLQTVDLSTHLDTSRVHGHITMSQTCPDKTDRQTYLLCMIFYSVYSTQLAGYTLDSTCLL